MSNIDANSLLIEAVRRASSMDRSEATTPGGAVLLRAAGSGSTSSKRKIKTCVALVRTLSARFPAWTHQKSKKPKI
ncbi:hypothetical protein [Bradyrhizobium prioriisuperbiae]|uniref:hypothetical protein n=1 Tax=Bradyrhizobium prioriisuperbiae TaxID=2854389 RepID=UPI0028E3708A|nr:hypothetical protein [Bradyrhizobium prioritasuperba]